MRIQPFTDEESRLGAAMAARKMFENRKGHGGGPCLRRNLTEEQLRQFAHLAIECAMTVRDVFAEKRLAKLAKKEEAAQ